MNYLVPAWKWFSEAMFPPRCIVTREEGSYLCEDLRIFPPAPSNQASFEYLDQIYAHTAYYDPVVEKVVEYFKFKGFRQLADIMVHNIPQNLAHDFCERGVLVPIPLYWTRQMRRGFNQSEVLAQALSQTVQLPVVKAIQRCKKTHQQARLGRSDRLENLKNAFVWKGAKIPSKVLLVDDVVASGSTLDQAAKACKQAGVNQVFAIVFARGGKN